MGWGEAWRLTQRLVLDTSSHVAASIAGWSQPWPREALIAADTYDLLAKVHAKRPKPYPRPWASKDTSRYGKATRPQAEIRAALLARGHGRVLYRRDARGRMHDERGRFVAG